MENNAQQDAMLTDEELLAQLDEQHRIRIEKLNEYYVALSDIA